MTESDIFEPFERLVEIEVPGEKYQFPKTITLLRCFQYLSLETISRGDFCWNGNCVNCQVWLDDTAKERPILSCRTKARERMKIVRLSQKLNCK